VSAAGHAVDERLVDLWDQTMQAVGLREWAAALQAVLVICRAHPLASASEIGAKVMLIAAHGDAENIVPALPPDVSSDELELALEVLDG